MNNIWHEKDGIIYFSVTSDGTTGGEWIIRLESKGSRVGGYAKQVLRSSHFTPTDGVTTQVAVLKGVLFEDNDLITRKILVYAGERKLTAPNVEIVCLIREKFTDKEIKAMGLWGIIVMHEPIHDFDGDPSLLGASHDGHGHRLDAYCGRPGNGWHRDCGFAFAEPSTS